jgi:glycosyltransferase involved in cell wall biosynthesis
LIKIGYSCFTNPKVGYAVAAMNYINALRQGGYSVEVDPYEFQFQKHKAVLGCHTATCDSSLCDIHIQHCVPDFLRRGKNRFTSRFNLAFATFETLEPPKRWQELLERYSAVLTPSMFNYNIFKELCPNTKVYYVPHCLDFQIYNFGEQSSSPPGYQGALVSGKFLFLWIGKWKRRKGYIELIEAFRQEFKDDEKASLVLKTHDKIQAETYLKSLGNPQRISVDSSFTEEVNMAGFLRATNCVVMPSYGEGFGLAGLQAMACGVPLIVTDYSGIQDYATSRTANLLAPDGLERIEFLDGIAQFKNRPWAKISVNRLRALMREVYENQEAARLKAAAAGTFVRERFSYEACIAKFQQIFADLG